MKPNRIRHFSKRYLMNKYVVVSLFFLLWLVFMDTNNLFTQWKMYSELKKQEDMATFYKKEIEKNEKEIHKIKTDIHYVEKIARERFLMKREEEDIFIFIEKP